MARYDMDFERGYGFGYRRSPTGESWTGRGWRGRTAGRRPLSAGEPGYTHEYEGYGARGWPREWGRGRRTTFRTEGYGGEYLGYGREYGRSRWEIDYGDPFRDRARGTPIRMMRGGWDERRPTGYGREFTTGYGEEFRGGYGGGYGRGSRRRWRY